MTPEDVTKWFFDALANPNVVGHLRSVAFDSLASGIKINDKRIYDLENEVSSLRIELEYQKQYNRRNAVRTPAMCTTPWCQNGLSWGTRNTQNAFKIYLYILDYSVYPCDRHSCYPALM